MHFKSKLISLLILFSFFIANNGIGKKIVQTIAVDVEVQQSVSESQDPGGEETIKNIKDILHSTVRKTGASHQHLHFLKNNNKSIVAYLTNQNSFLLNSFYAGKNTYVKNNINHPPFYIAYHRLLI